MDKTAGVRLREDLDKALAAAARQQGRALEWDEREVLTLEMAAEAADRCVELRALLATVLASPRLTPNATAALAGELRLTEKAVIDLIGKVNIGTGHVKSARHVAAGQARMRGHAAQF